MKHMILRFVLAMPIALLVLAVAGADARGADRFTNSRGTAFDADWRFLRAEATAAETPGYDDSAWRRLDLPHDWSIDDLPSTNGAPPSPFDPAHSAGGASTGFVVGGTGWYRKHFTLPAATAGKPCRTTYGRAAAFAHRTVKAVPRGAFRPAWSKMTVASASFTFRLVRGGYSADASSWSLYLAGIGPSSASRPRGQLPPRSMPCAIAKSKAPRSAPVWPPEMIFRGQFIVPALRRPVAFRQGFLKLVHSAIKSRVLVQRPSRP